MIRKLVLTLAIATCGSAAFSESLTTTRLVRPNAIIAPTDLGVLSVDVPGALPSDADIIGLEARVTLYPGRPILLDHVGQPALIERNQPVVVFFQNRGLTIATDGRALSRGAQGDVVRVMNLSSRHTVSGRVQADGSVVVLSREILR
jgi:flagella basal body P-ring formation protein FlgA